jgi:polyphenol oxidase
MQPESPYLRPAWPAPAHVQTAFTTRAGGVSVAPFDALNLGDHVQDNPEHVLQNRLRLQRSLAVRPVFLKQVHGVEVATLDARTSNGTLADACITTQRGLACTIMVADCLPVLFTDRAGSFVAAAHAGWRGLLGQDGQGILEQTYQSFRPLAQQNQAQAATKFVVLGGVLGGVLGMDNEVLAWLGPCIGPDAFEVGAEVQAAFVAAQPGAAQHFQKIMHLSAEGVQSASSQGIAAQGMAAKGIAAKGTPAQGDKYLCNLSGLARDRLQALGITQIYGNDGSAPWCTVGNPLQFFSHRRDATRLGSTGRMAACIWLA